MIERTSDQVLEFWRTTLAAADWGPGDRVKVCTARRALFAVYGQDELLALLDLSSPEPKVHELFDQATQDLLLGGQWRELQ